MRLKSKDIEADDSINSSHYLPLLDLSSDEKSLVGIYVIQEKKFVYTNQRLADIFGYERGELLKIQSILDVISSDYHEATQKEYQKRLDGIPNESAHELMIIRKTGETRWVEILGIKTSFNDKPAVAGFLLDIHHRKRLEIEREYTRFQLRERIKELTTLYKTGRLVQQEERASDEVLTEIVNILPTGWQYPEITEARISIGERYFETMEFKKFPQNQVATFDLPDNLRGEIEVGYKQMMSEEFEGAFLAEERNLINMLAEIIRVYLTRKHERDILKKSEANLRTIFDHTEVGYLLLTKDLNIVSYNRPFEVEYAKSVDLKIKEGDYLPDLLPEKNRDNLLIQMNTVLDSTNIISYETVYSTAQDEDIYFWITIIPVKNLENSILGICISAQNITDRKKMEAELAAYNVKLEKEVERQTMELKIANRELDTFNYSISHDIRIPLRAIEMFSEVVKGTDGLSEKHLELMYKIDTCTTQMRNMISSLLEFARVGKLSLKKEMVDMHAMINECIGGLSGEYSATVNVLVDEPLIVSADPVLLRQVLINLLSNAFKYSSKKKKPLVEIVGKTANGFLEIQIRDNGAGFDPEFADQLFLPFSRLHSASEFEGNGAGLSIVERIISRHGGKIWAEGKPGKGATFSFILPVN